MSRCTTWRYLGAEDITRILPIGKDHNVWKPCRNRVEIAGAWCDECIGALLLCPEVEVRRALVEHEHLSDDQLRFLTSDADYETQHRAAERLLARRDVWS